MTIFQIRKQVHFVLIAIILPLMISWRSFEENQSFCLLGPQATQRGNRNTHYAVCPPSMESSIYAHKFRISFGCCGEENYPHITSCPHAGRNPLHFSVLLSPNEESFRSLFVSGHRQQDSQILRFSHGLHGLRVLFTRV